MKGRKADLEALMMYIWLFEIGGSNNDFWPEFCNEYEEKTKSEL